MRSIVKQWFLTVVYLLFSLFVISQDTDYIWLLGNHGENPLDSAWGITKLNFHPNDLEVSYVGEISLYFNRNSITISENENILFYTNGTSVQNSNYEYMENGIGLNEGDSIFGNSLVQGMICLDHPGSGIYSLVSWKEGWISSEIGLAGILMRLSRIDMNLNGGLGKVVVRNDTILDSSEVGLLDFSRFTACRHANGRDWWVIYFKFDSNKYFRALIGNAGVELLESDTVEYSFRSGVGRSTFSSDGTKYARYSRYDFPVPAEIDIFDFDRCTGRLSNQFRFENMDSTDAGNGSVAFSLNNRFLYLNTNFFLYQYDLWEDDIEESETLIGMSDNEPAPVLTASFFTSQIGPDGRIYINSGNGVKVLHYIEKPHLKGQDAKFKRRGLDLLTNNWASIPNNPNYRLGPIDGSDCDTLGIDNIPLASFRYDRATGSRRFDFIDLSAYEPDTWYWDFDDGTTSNERYPSTHTFPNADKYEVCLTVTNENGSDTFCKTIDMRINVSTTEPKYILEGINLTPNPFQENLSLSYRFPEETRFRLFDESGKMVLEESLKIGPMHHSFDTSSLSPGVYFYSFVSKSGYRAQGKVIKVD